MLLHGTIQDTGVVAHGCGRGGGGRSVAAITDRNGGSWRSGSCGGHCQKRPRGCGPGREVVMMMVMVVMQQMMMVAEQIADKGCFRGGVAAAIGIVAIVVCIIIGGSGSSRKCRKAGGRRFVIVDTVRFATIAATFGCRHRSRERITPAAPECGPAGSGYRGRRCRQTQRAVVIFITATFGLVTGRRRRRHRGWHC